MKEFKEIQIDCSNTFGYVECRSTSMVVSNTLNDFHRKVTFTVGVNALRSEPDSGSWALSYMLSMYRHRPKDFMMDPPPVKVDGQNVPLRELTKSACYLNTLDPLFSSRRRTVESLVTEGIRKNKLSVSPQEIMELCGMTECRFNRPVTATSTEMLNAMAAIGHCWGRHVFCLPWMSKDVVKTFGHHMDFLLKGLTALGHIVIYPHSVIVDDVILIGTNTSYNFEHCEYDRRKFSFSEGGHITVQFEPRQEEAGM